MDILDESPIKSRKLSLLKACWAKDIQTSFRRHLFMMSLECDEVESVCDVLRGADEHVAVVARLHPGHGGDSGGDSGDSCGGATARTN